MARRPLFGARHNPGAPFDPLADLVNEFGQGIPDNQVPAYISVPNNEFGGGAPDNMSDIYSFDGENDPYGTYDGPFGERAFNPVNRRNPRHNPKLAAPLYHAPADSSWRQQFGQIASLAREIQKRDGCSQKEAFANARLILESQGAAAVSNPINKKTGKKYKATRYAPGHFDKPSQERTYRTVDRRGRNIAGAAQLRRVTQGIMEADGCDLGSAWDLARGKDVSAPRAARASFQAGSAKANPQSEHVRMGSRDLYELAAQGDSAASAELSRREEKRALTNGMRRR